MGLYSFNDDLKAVSFYVCLANRSGVWNLYKAETDLKWDHNLAAVIHKPDQLNKLIAEFIESAE
jgi:hypothetical protein